MAKKKHTASSQRWLDEHFEDEYVKKAQKLGLRSRAVFKIEEINNKDKLIKKINKDVSIRWIPAPTQSRKQRETSNNEEI